MAFGDFFRAAPSNNPQQPAGQGGAPGGQQPQGNGGQQGDPSNGNMDAMGGQGGTQGQQPAAKPDPFAHLSKMFDNPGDEAKAPSFELSGDVLDRAAGASDFMQGANPEWMTKLTAGDFSVLPEMINHAARNGYKQSLSHSGKLTEAYTGKRDDFNGSKVKGEVHSTLTNQALAGINVKNPVVRQQLSDTAKRIARTNPDMSPQEVADAAKQYFLSIAGELNPDSQNNGGGSNGRSQQAEVDWDSYFDQDASTTNQ